MHFGQDPSILFYLNGAESGSDAVHYPKPVMGSVHRVKIFALPSFAPSPLPRVERWPRGPSRHRGLYRPPGGDPVRNCPPSCATSYHTKNRELDVVVAIYFERIGGSRKFESDLCKARPRSASRGAQAFGAYGGNAERLAVTIRNLTEKSKTRLRIVFSAYPCRPCVRLDSRTQYPRPPRLRYSAYRFVVFVSNWETYNYDNLSIKTQPF